MQKSLVNVQPTLVADDSLLNWLNHASVRSPPLRSYPAVPSQLLAALNSFACNARSNAPLYECSPAPLEVIPFVSVQLARPLSAPPAEHAPLLDWFDGINNVCERVGVVNVSRCTDYRERNSFGVDHRSVATLALRARF